MIGDADACEPLSWSHDVVECSVDARFSRSSSGSIDALVVATVGGQESTDVERVTWMCADDCEYDLIENKQCDDGDDTIAPL